MRHTVKFKRWLAAASLSLLIPPGISQASDYPSKPITLIVPFAAGGMSDRVARKLSPLLHEKFKVPVIVENRPGAGGSIGNRVVATAPGDGYTLLVASAGITTEAVMRKDLPYDMTTDLAAVTKLVVMPNVVIVHDKFVGKSLAELIDYAKKNPGAVTAASSGVGSSTHFAAEMFNGMADIKTTHVPYKGGAPTWVAISAGEVDMLIDPIVNAKQLVDSGKVRALALAASERSPFWPELPTTAEAGLPGYEVDMWFGLFAPGTTPPELVGKIQREFSAVLNLPEVKEWGEQIGLSIVGDTPEAFTKSNADEIDRWSEIARINHITNE